MEDKKGIFAILRLSRAKIIVFCIMFMLVGVIPILTNDIFPGTWPRMQLILPYLFFFMDTVEEYVHGDLALAVVQAGGFIFACLFLYFITCLLVELFKEQRAAIRRMVKPKK